MKCVAGFRTFRLLRSIPVLSAILVCLVGCEYMNKDMLGYLQKWTDTVQVGRVEVSNASIQKNDSGVDTIPVSAIITVTGYIVNPQGYALDSTVGAQDSTINTVRVSSAILPQTKVVSSDSTMIAVKLAAADESLEHTSFIVSFVPVRTDNLQSAPSGKEMTLRYNTPSLPPARVNQVVAEDGSVSYAVVKEGELWKAAADGNLYWAWDDSVTDEASPKYAKWFDVGGTRRLLADCKVSPETKMGTRSLFHWSTGNASTTLAAVDGEGVSSPTITSGTFVPAGSDVTGPGSVTSLAAAYSADDTITVTWTDPMDTDGDLQEIVVGLNGGTVTKSPIVVAKGAQQAQFTGIPGDGKLYTVTVVARDASGNESVPATAQVLADATAPASVTGLAASYDQESITVTWSDPTDNDLEKIEVRLSSGNGSVTSQFVQKGIQSATFTGIPEDRTMYTVTAAAVDASGNKSAPETITVVADKTGPGSVTSLAAAYSADGTITVTWTDPVDTDGDLQEIVVSLSGGAASQATSVGPGTQRATFSGIADDKTQYTVTMVARDASGNESVPASTTVWADKTGPGQVTNVQASSGETTVTLTWVNPSPAQDDLAAVKVTCTAGGLAVSAITVSASQTAGTQGSATISAASLTTGTEYTFTITTEDDLGNSDSSSHSFTWQKLTLDSIIGTSFTKDGAAVPGASGAKLVLYYLKGSTVQEGVYTAYKPTAADSTFSYWKSTSTGSQQTGVITMSADVTLIANYSSVSAANAANYINTLTGTSTHDVKIIGNLTNNQIKDINAISVLKSGSLKINLDLSGVTGMSTLQSYAFSSMQGLMSITLPDELTTIDNYAFTGCTNLATVVLPQNLTSINHGSFENCTSLTTLNLPANCIFEAAAFYGCTSLSSITVDSGSSYSTSDNGSVVIKDGTILALYIGNSSMYSIGNNIKTIGKNAFSSRTSLQSVTISSGVTNIEDYAFSGCSSLSKVDLSSATSLETIGRSVFTDCNLTEITIPASVKTITSSFAGCNALTTVTFNDTSNWTISGNSIDVTNPSTNAINLRGTGGTSVSIWMYSTLIKS